MEQTQRVVKNLCAYYVANQETVKTITIRNGADVCKYQAWQRNFATTLLI
jgi:hypothetical protein